MTRTIDLDAAWLATLAPLPGVLAAAVNEALAPASVLSRLFGTWAAARAATSRDDAKVS